MDESRAVVKSSPRINSIVGVFMVEIALGLLIVLWLISRAVQ